MDITGVSVNKSNSKGWLSNLFDSPAPAPSGCGDETTGSGSPVIDQLEDGGIPGSVATPPYVPDVRYGGGEAGYPDAEVDEAGQEDLPNVSPDVFPTSHVTPEGAIIIVEGNRIEIYPTENEYGEVEWYGAYYLEYTGAGLTQDFVNRESPWIQIQWPETGDSDGVAGLQLELAWGSCSTHLVGMPEDPELAFFPNLLNITPATDEDREHGFYCSETAEDADGTTYEPYSSFAQCPTNPDWSLPMYNGQFDVQCIRHTGDEEEVVFETAEPIQRTNIDDLNNPPADGAQIENFGLLCPDYPGVDSDHLPNRFILPRECNSNGFFDVRLSLTNIINARGRDQYATYGTLMNFRIRVAQ